jgi:hypothetical protein
MFRLQFRMRYGTYLRSEHGIKKFAERSMGQLIHRVTKKSAFYREMNENLLVEKANLRMRATELYEQPMLKAGEFFGVRRRLWTNAFISTAVVTAAIFLVFLSISAFITDETGLVGFLRWFVSIVLAIVLAAGGLVVAERLIETLIPQRDPIGKDMEDAGPAIATLWGVLLVAIELAILSIVEVRASQFGAMQNSNFLYFGFISLTMMLPIIAGTIRWDAMRYMDAYKTTRAHREIDSRLAQIDSILRQNEEYESNFYKIKSIEHWDLLNEFKTYKDLYNQKHGLVERLDGHFAQTYDTFQREAYKRYASDLRDITSKSMRRLDVGAGAAGSKIGQAISAGTKIEAAPMPDRNPNGGSGGREAIEGSDIYLSPKPIR